ncbi:nucleotidyltransferase domain-containing protein [Nocardia sp. NPDC019395]|uniref:nucleotidyltransferase domain-containing protein n=1 Tax=Nocardia sp. NPDC019395 TaxID=3154686 RepID=UPI0033C228B3
MNTDEDFVARIAGRLAALPGVVAVTLGGSRAQGTHGPDSDWDFALYYRDRFDPATLRAVGWKGEVTELGAWGGVFNGGAWLTIEGRAVDVHYRDLTVIEHELTEAEQGRFRWEPLAFHLAGIPAYLVVGELAVSRVLRGELPRPEFPAAMREAAPPIWRRQADLTLRYARSAHAPRGRVTETAGALATAAMQTAHAILAARGEWVTNEKRLLERAGLREIDTVITRLSSEPAALTGQIDAARQLFEAADARETGVARS